MKTVLLTLVFCLGLLCLNTTASAQYTSITWGTPTVTSGHLVGPPISTYATVTLQWQTNVVEDPNYETPAGYDQRFVIQQYKWVHDWVLTYNPETEDFELVDFGGNEWVYVSGFVWESAGLATTGATPNLLFVTHNPISQGTTTYEGKFRQAMVEWKFNIFGPDDVVLKEWSDTEFIERDVNGVYSQTTIARTGS